MKILIVTGLKLEQFIRVGGDNPEMPRQPQSYPYYGKLKNAGLEVDILSLYEDIGLIKSKSQFSTYLKTMLMINSIASYDVIISWGFVGAWLSLLLKFTQTGKKTLTVVFANVSPSSHRVTGRFKNLLFHMGLRSGKGVIYMTKEQLNQSLINLKLSQEQLIYLPAGVDIKFFFPNSYSESLVIDNKEILQLAGKSYIVVAGDQLRNEIQILDILKQNKLSLVRLTQSGKTEEFWKNVCLSKDKDFNVFCKANLPYHDVRYIYQHALCLLNLVDNSWQPAGWTVMTEAMACGIPVIMNSGLVTRELKNYCEHLPLIEISSTDIFGEINKTLKNILDDKAFRDKLGTAGRKFVEDNLDIEKTSDELLKIFSS